MIKSVVLALLVAVILQHALKICLLLQLEKSDAIYGHAPGPCIQLSKTAEYVISLKEQIIDEYVLAAGIYEHWKGRILLFDFNNPTHKLTELSIEGNLNTTDFDAFRPHGLSAWIDSQSGVVTVMLVNHPPEGDTVEIFQFNRNNKNLLHLQSIKNPMFTSLNDVVATSSNTFYVTAITRSPFRNDLSKLAETLLLVKLGRLLYFDGTSVSSVANGLLAPNGINLSPDKRYLYVTSGRKISSYEIIGSDKLQLTQYLDMDSTLDNIDVDTSTGDLWVGAHPLSYMVMLYLTNPETAKAPSQVLKFRVKDGQFKTVTEVYLNDGEEISASSVAVKYKGRMLVGSISSQILLCDLLFVS